MYISWKKEIVRCALAVLRYGKQNLKRGGPRFSSCSDFAFSSSSQRKSGAFTLIESLIAIFLVAVAISVFLTAWAAISFSKSAKHKGIAAQIASRQIEDLQATTSPLSVGSVSISDPQLGQLPNGSGTLNIEEYDPANPGLKHVWVVIDWTEKAETRSLRMDTLIAR